VSLGPFVVRLERQDIGIGGLIGGIVNGMLIRYPSSIERSMFATIEPFQYQVIIFLKINVIINEFANKLLFFSCEKHQIWIGIVLSFLAVAACSWFSFYISRRFLNLEMSDQGVAAKTMIYFFKVIVQQGKQIQLIHIFSFY